MTPTELASALRDVEIANEETNYAKFQSDAAIVEEAAGIIGALGDPNTVYVNILRGTIAMSRANAIALIGNAMYECKDLEWEEYSNGHMAQGVRITYQIKQRGREEWDLEEHAPRFPSGYGNRYDSLPSAQAATNEHNKQQFQNIIEEWRKG